MRALHAVPDNAPCPTVKRGVYDAPFPPADYRGLYMVSEDGTLLVEIRVHRRAMEKDLVPGFRGWLARIEEKERRERSPLTLVTPDEGDAKAS